MKCTTTSGREKFLREQHASATYLRMKRGGGVVVGFGIANGWPNAFPLHSGAMGISCVCDLRERFFFDYTAD